MLWCGLRLFMEGMKDIDNSRSKQNIKDAIRTRTIFESEFVYSAPYARHWSGKRQSQCLSRIQSRQCVS
jgi:hypothetical protein